MSEAPATPDAAGDEIGRLRERVAFYESFDRIIQENIARSGDLLREAAEIRETAQREIATAQAAAAEQVTRERDRHRQSISALLGEMTRLQQQIERLWQRLNEELDAMDGQPRDLELSAPERTAGAETEGELSPVAEHQAAPAAFVIPDGESPPRTGEAVSTIESSPDGGKAAPHEASADVAGPQSVTVLVHGVPRAAAALSLQRHLAALASVEGVEAREFAEGILRLQVFTHRPLGLDDLGGWADGAGLTPVTVLDDVLEVRLPGAESL